MWGWRQEVRVVVVGLKLILISFGISCLQLHRRLRPGVRWHFSSAWGEAEVQARRPAGGSGQRGCCNQRVSLSSRVEENPRSPEPYIHPWVSGGTRPTRGAEQGR